MLTRREGKNSEAIRKAIPENIGKIHKALTEFLKQCLFESCATNKEYIQALGFGNDKNVSQKK